MASADVQLPPSAPHLSSSSNASAPTVKASTPAKDTHDVVTTLHYYLDPKDGSEPAPTYVGKPETYFRPADSRTVTIHNLRGRESEPHLDTTGFQFIKHESKEKDFTDEDKIKSQYYNEVEELLKSS
jgi:hypothetical protein